MFRTPPLYARLLRQHGIDLARRSGNPAWLLPVPAPPRLACAQRLVLVQAARQMQDVRGDRSGRTGETPAEG